MKYSNKFEKDYEWYLKHLDTFNFDGVDKYINKNGIDIIQYDEQGLTAKECFYLYDSQGVIEKCKEPELYHKLLRCKGSVNLHIQMWSQDRAKGYLPKFEFDLICIELNLLDWMVEAVEQQKYKHYDNTRNISTD